MPTGDGSLPDQVLKQRSTANCLFSLPDQDGQATGNLIWGCPSYSLLLGGCVDFNSLTLDPLPFTWHPYSAYDLFDLLGSANWSGWGDIVADVGFNTGGEPATCP